VDHNDRDKAATEFEKRADAARPQRCLLHEYGGGWTGLSRRVAIDLGPDTISVSAIDGQTSALLASTGRAQVSATPAAFTAAKQDRGRTMPVLIVRVAGMQPLTIGCDVPAANPVMALLAPRPRFWWRGKVPWVKTPTYAVGADDWLKLVENLGLGPYLDDKTNPHRNETGSRWVTSAQDLEAAAQTGRDRRSPWTWFLTIVLAVLAFLGFFFGGVNCYRYLAGTPTTATIIDCSNRSNCRATWSAGGASQTGPIAVEFSTPRVGSSLDVRVADGIARTATFWLGGFVVGAVLLGCSLLLFVLTRSRTGTLVANP
jgi:hypothetical protein